MRRWLPTTASNDRVESIDIYVVDLRQDQPYLGSLRGGETVNEAGYFVRKGNRTVYPRHNRSLVVRLTTKDGVVGWGETYGLVAPKATAEIIKDLLKVFVLGRDPFEVEALHDELYDLLRVRGYTGGFYLDALAAIDIALWDIVGKTTGSPLSELLGRKRETIPAYVSGLPEDSLEQRCDLAKAWQAQGFDSFKFASPVADQGVGPELHALRLALGEDARIACDLHWAHSSQEAVELAHAIAADRPWFLEAPVATEDIEALRFVTQNSGQLIAAGEEWRTIYDAKLRIDHQACHVVQPEMGHTGVTQFLRVGEYAVENGLRVIPHATIGSGIFLAASLQASAALADVDSHEFQHSIFKSFRSYTGDAMHCENGEYQIPDGSGLGVSPSERMLTNMQRLS